jgi:group II intron reverse transcriptase/maturase
LLRVLTRIEIDNLADLAERLKTKRYKTKLIRRKYIPKENGKLRPLGIPALEDKITQRAVAMILENIYEQDFLECSYGYRPKRSARGAISDLNFQLQYGVTGYIVEADIKGFFDNLDHDLLLEMLALRIDDKALLHLIRKWLKAGILEPDGMVIHPDTGTPQGGIVSPILANIYLHYVLDTWFNQAVKPRLRGRAFIYRYADDWVCGFQYRDDAERFYRTMPKRLAKFNLEVEPSKTKILRFSRFHPSRMQDQTFAFLGFEFYWWHDQAGIARIKRRTARKKQLAKVQLIKDWIKKKRHLPKHEFFGTLKRKLTGHYNYYYVVGNSRAVWSFYSQAIEQTFKWLNRRSQRKSYNWETFRNVLSFMNVPVPRVTEKKGLNNVKLH